VSIFWIANVAVNTNLAKRKRRMFDWKFFGRLASY